MRLRRRTRTRVLSVGYLPPELGGSQRGGIATFHGTLLAELAAHRRYGVEVTGVLVSPPDELDPERVAQCPAPILEHRQPQRAGRRYARMLRQARPDVVVFNHITNRYLARWARIHRRLADEIPALGIAHSWHPVTRYAGEEAEKRLEIAQGGVSAVDALSFGSDHCRREGAELGIAYPPVAEVIQYPLQHAYAKSVEVDEFARRGIVYMGSLLPRKNVASLVEAVASRPGLELVIAGEGPEEANIRALVGRLGVGDRVELVHHYPTDEHLARMRELLLRSAVLCLPSTSESFGLVMIEALACGTPVVGFGPGMAEIDERAGIRCGERIEAGTTEEVGRAIDRVLAAQWDRHELSRRVVDAFAPRHAAGAYAELIRRLASGG